MLQSIKNNATITVLAIIITSIAGLFFFYSGITHFLEHTDPNERSVSNFIEQKPGEKHRIDHYSYYFSTGKDSAEAVNQVQNQKFKSSKEVVDFIFTNRLDEYQLIIEDISNLLRNLAILIGISLLMLFYKPDKLPIPFLNINIPNSLIYPFCIIGILYMWLQFGLSFNSGIDARLALEEVININESIGGKHLSYKLSSLNALTDQGPIDTFFGKYFNTFESSKSLQQGLMTALGMFGIYGTFWGLIHGTTLVLIVEYYRQKKHNFIFILFVFVLAMFLAADFTFFKEFEFSSFLLSWVWLFALFSVVWWELFGIRYATIISIQNPLDKDYD